MKDSPWKILGISAEAEDSAVRARYLTLVREFPPEQHPERFAAIRDAYEKVRDTYSRVNYRLFEQGRDESLDAIIEELSCQNIRPRLTLAALLKEMPPA